MDRTRLSALGGVVDDPMLRRPNLCGANSVVRTKFDFADDVRLTLSPTIDNGVRLVGAWYVVDRLWWLPKNRLLFVVQQLRFARTTSANKLISYGRWWFRAIRVCVVETSSRSSDMPLGGGATEIMGRRQSCCQRFKILIWGCMRVCAHTTIN